MGGYQLSPVVRLGLILRFIYNCDLKIAYFIVEDYIKAWDLPYSVDPACQVNNDLTCTHCVVSHVLVNLD